MIDNNPGVLLIGSTARGELSWVKKRESVQLFSDIEFLVAVTKKCRKKEQIFQQMISKLEAEYDLGDLFHIDYTIITWNTLPRLDKKFFIFECQQCGIDLGRYSIRSELPMVNRSNLNWRELNEVLLHRLNSILHIIPLSIFDNKMTEREQIILALNLAKNSLDITTWLHPYEADKLVPGFTSRLAEWDKDFLEKSKLGEYLTLEDVEYLENCLALRRVPNQKADVKVMLSQTISLYSKAISYCKVMNDINEETSISNFLPSMKLFDEYRFRQRISQLISMLDNLRIIGLAKTIRNSIAVRRGVAVNVCHYMLLSINDYINGRDSSWSNLHHASSELSRLVRNKEFKNDDFIQSWIEMRELFKKYQDISHNY